MIKKTTWVLIGIAIALGGGVYFYEVVDKTQKAETISNQAQIFDFQADDITTITIIQPQQTLEFVRGNSPNEWQMRQPQATPAEPAAVEFLVDLIENGSSDRRFSVSSDQLSQYGLNSPLATIKIKLKNQQEHQLVLGKPNLGDQLIYAQINPDSNSTDTVDVALIPKNFQYAVERELREWKLNRSQSDSQ